MRSLKHLQNKDAEIYSKAVQPNPSSTVCCPALKASSPGSRPLSLAVLSQQLHSGWYFSFDAMFPTFMNFPLTHFATRCRWRGARVYFIDQEVLIWGEPLSYGTFWVVTLRQDYGETHFTRSRPLQLVNQPHIMVKAKIMLRLF